MLLGWIMLVYNRKQYKKEKKEAEIKMLREIQIKRARLLPLYNENYRKRFNADNKSV
jgi:hypothetical protein